ncbi:MAG: 30S ribosomal protein S16 [Candidatus Saccharimonadales bacterium]
MLAIRMQRTGRKGYPTYRVIVQEAHRQPTSGKVVANLGSYNPHTKETSLDKEKVATFLKNGAQPSDRVVKLLQAEKVALPAWVKVTSDKKQKTIKNVEKLRRNQPKDEVAEARAEEAAPEAVPAETAVEETPATEAPVEETKTSAEDKASDDKKA